jgi:hypothetical protein
VRDCCVATVMMMVTGGSVLGSVACLVVIVFHEMLSRRRRRESQQKLSSRHDMRPASGVGSVVACGAVKLVVSKVGSVAVTEQSPGFSSKP